MLSNLLVLAFALIALCTGAVVAIVVALALTYRLERDEWEND